MDTNKKEKPQLDAARYQVTKAASLLRDAHYNLLSTQFVKEAEPLNSIDMTLRDMLVKIGG